MKTFIRIMDKINLGIKFLLGTILALALIILTWQIISRAVFNAPLSWSSELLRYLLVWTTFIGAGLAIRYQKLIRLEFLFSLFKFPPKIEKGIRGLAAVITMVFCVIILMYSVQILEIVHMQKSAAMHLPMSIPYLAIPLGSLIMLFNTLVAWLEGEWDTKGGEQV
ncbi:TRAP transporter small permease [Bacillus sp. FJAT-29790]|uniref:TRAP transporter small permease n=1 Tax=Bacillus sp. FJAT-29790 TaxID=1895002 RepID=UPI001C216ADF|nr:TRAP transporter small permease [Bacillus sp. FJAT-29790]MBU8881345.1 TRAP transporter small permease [Bacillus sp. FJAT-29790]